MVAIGPFAFCSINPNVKFSILSLFLQWTVCFIELQLGPPEFICKIQLLAKDIRHGNETVQYGETVPSVLELSAIFVRSNRMPLFINVSIAL